MKSVVPITIILGAIAWFIVACGHNQSQPQPTGQLLDDAALKKYQTPESGVRLVEKKSTRSLSLGTSPSSEKSDSTDAKTTTENISSGPVEADLEEADMQSAMDDADNAPDDYPEDNYPADNEDVTEAASSSDVEDMNTGGDDE